MSDEQQHSFEEKLDTISKLVSLMKWVIGGAVALGLWAGALEIRTQANAMKLSDIEHEQRDMVIWKAESNGNRFTASDHNKYATAASEQITAHDKRLTKVEDAITSITKSLDRIENKLEIQRSGK